jgi:Protein of unknown function (DUF664)
MLHRYLRETREALLWKLEGLPEYDVRRPLTPTGTSLLGLVKHCAAGECVYLGRLVRRPFPREQDLDWGDGGDVAAEGGRRHAGTGHRRVEAPLRQTRGHRPLGPPGA